MRACALNALLGMRVVSYPSCSKWHAARRVSYYGCSQACPSTPAGRSRWRRRSQGGRRRLLYRRSPDIAVHLHSDAVGVALVVPRVHAHHLQGQQQGQTQERSAATRQLTWYSPERRGPPDPHHHMPRHVKRLAISRSS